LDLVKAFDRIKWYFIVKALKRQGFHDHFIDLVYKCISTTTLSVIINDQPTPSVHPQRGAFPLPFYYCYELSICLQHHSDIHNIHEVTLGPDCPRIHSLLFANDLIICSQATHEEAMKINSILQSFYKASGQTSNLAKSSIMFSKKVDEQSKLAIKNIFPVPISLQIPSTMAILSFLSIATGPKLLSSSSINLGPSLYYYQSQ